MMTGTSSKIASSPGAGSKLKVVALLLAGSLLILLTVGGCTYQGKLRRTPSTTGDLPSEASWPTWTADAKSRGWDERVVYYQNTEVRHRTLYFRDPYEHVGDNDAYVRTGTRNDLISTIGGPVWFAMNLLLLPHELYRAVPWSVDYSRSFFELQEPVHEVPVKPSLSVRDEDIRRAEAWSQSPAAEDRGE